MTSSVIYHLIQAEDDFYQLEILRLRNGDLFLQELKSLILGPLKTWADPSKARPVKNYFVYYTSEAIGFSPERNITLNFCDVYDLSNEERLCGHTELAQWHVSPMYRCGNPFMKIKSDGIAFYYK